MVGIVEIENDGYGPVSAVADLVGKLNAATAPNTYAYVNVDAETGQQNALGTDAIKVGVIYKPASVTPVGLTAVLNTVSFVTGGDTFDRNRPALAQAFQTPAGGRFVVVINHLKSKGSACDTPDQGDGQGNCNAVREAAARELTAWLATDPTATDAGALVLGDLNSYAQEDPVTALKSAGFINLVEQLSGPSAYSYVFDGQWGYLDHALVSPALGAQVTGLAEYHINADEPSVLDYNDDFKSAGQIASLYAPDAFRMADHDPIVVGLDPAPESVGPRRPAAVGWRPRPATTRQEPLALRGKVAYEFAARYPAGVDAADRRRLSLLLPSRPASLSRAPPAWLTVSGRPARSLQGEGTVRGVGGYSFKCHRSSMAC